MSHLPVTNIPNETNNQHVGIGEGCLGNAPQASEKNRNKKQSTWWWMWWWHATMMWQCNSHTPQPPTLQQHGSTPGATAGWFWFIQENNLCNEGGKEPVWRWHPQPWQVVSGTAPLQVISFLFYFIFATHDTKSTVINPWHFVLHVAMLGGCRLIPFFTLLRSGTVCLLLLLLFFQGNCCATREK